MTKKRKRNSNSQKRHTSNPRNHKGHTLENADFRFGFISTIAEDATGPGGIMHKAGALVEVSASSKYTEILNRHFPMPEMTALYLNTSHKAHKAVIKLRKKMVYEGINSQPSIEHLISDPKFLFDMFEQQSIAVVFAFSALESFVNSSIPNDYTYVVKTKKSTEHFDREQIERRINIEDKLSKVLVDIKKVGDVTKIKEWPTFNKLKSSRDKLIHLKHHEIFNADRPNEEAVWDVLNAPSYEDYSATLQGLFEFYYPKQDERPRWMSKLPFWKSN